MSRAPCSPISVMRSRRVRPSTAKRDDVAGLEREAARRQRELRALARGPGLEQPDLGDRGGLLGLQHERQIGDGDAAAAAGEAARFLDGGRIVAGGGDEGELGGGRQVGLLRAGEGGERLRRGGARPGASGVERRRRRLPAPRWAKTMRPSLSRVSKKKASSSGCRASRADSTRSMTRPASMPVSAAGVVVGEAVVGEDGARRWRPAARWRGGR